MDESILSVSPTPIFNLPTEETILKAWQRENLYAQLLRRAGAAHYTIREMPSTIYHFKWDAFKGKIYQDIFLKIQMMRGLGVAYIPLWNYYTPAVERHVLNATPKDTPLDSLQFRKQCRRRFQHEVEYRQQQLRTLGIFGDWEGASKDLDSRYESKLINIFSKLRNLGYLKKDRYLGYWCQKCRTALSEDEIEIRPSQIYSGYVKFPVNTGLEEFGEHVYFAVWVETLWHLAGGVALGLRKGNRYLIAEFGSEVIVFAENDLATYLSSGCHKNITFLRTIKADLLMDCICTHPLLGTNLPVVSVPDLPEYEDLPSYGTSSSAAGLIHLAPGHQPADYRMAQALNLPIPSVVDDTGCLTEDAELFCGLDVFEAGKFIALELEKRGYLVYAGAEEIPQPHCWTCGAPTLFRLVQQWIFSLDHNRLRHGLLHSNEYWENYSEKNVEWMQQIIQNSPDPCVSCHRGWGIPLPIFQCEKCNHQLSDGRVLRAIRDLISRRGTDVWFKLSVEELLPSDTVCPNCESKEFKKESTLLDSRFAVLLHTINNSDVKKTAVKHTNAIFFSKNQFQKWFAHLILTSVALHDTLPFKNLDLIPISSSTQSTEIDESFFNRYPTDVLRILGVHPDFDWASVESIAQQCQQEHRRIQELFCTMLSELSDFQPSRHKLSLDALLPLDTLALSITNQTLQSVELAYQQYQFYRAWGIVRDFCESELRQVYLPLLKRRFCRNATCYISVEEAMREKRSGQTALGEILRVLLQWLAPITPFLAEQIHALKRRLDANPSAHVCPSSADALAFSSVFLENWITRIDVPPIANADVRWKELSGKSTSHE